MRKEGQTGWHVLLRVLLLLTTLALWAALAGTFVQLCMSEWLQAISGHYYGVMAAVAVFVAGVLIAIGIGVKIVSEYLFDKIDDMERVNAKRDEIKARGAWQP